MAEFEEIIEDTTEGMKKLSKNKALWIAGGGVALLLFFLSKKSSGESEVVYVEDSYPSASASDEIENSSMGNQFDAYASMLDYQVTETMNNMAEQMQQQQQAYETALDVMAYQMQEQQSQYQSKFEDMQNSLVDIAQSFSKDYEKKIQELENKYKQEIENTAKEIQTRSYSNVETTQTYSEPIQRNTWYSGAIFGGRSLNPSAINYNDYKVREDSKVMINDKDQVIEHDKYGGTITYDKDHITFDYSNDIFSR